MADFEKCTLVLRTSLLIKREWCLPLEIFIARQHRAIAAPWNSSAHSVRLTQRILPSTSVLKISRNARSISYGNTVERKREYIDHRDREVPLSFQPDLPAVIVFPRYQWSTPLNSHRFEELDEIRADNFGDDVDADNLSEWKTHVKSIPRRIVPAPLLTAGKLPSTSGV